MSSLANYIHTLRYLRPAQVFGRVGYKLFRPRPDRREAPPLRAPSKPYAAPISTQVAMLAPDRFRFLNLEGTCAAAADWRGQDRTQLWTYHLYYFDDLNAVDAWSRRSWHEQLMNRWIDENPPGAGIGWDPYPVSRRIVTWITLPLAAWVAIG